jgi:hypothetical protein
VFVVCRGRGPLVLLPWMPAAVFVFSLFPSMSHPTPPPNFSLSLCQQLSVSSAVNVSNGNECAATPRANGHQNLTIPCWVEYMEADDPVAAAAAVLRTQSPVPGSGREGGHVGGSSDGDSGDDSDGHGEQPAPGAAAGEDAPFDEDIFTALGSNTQGRRRSVVEIRDSEQVRLFPGAAWRHTTRVGHWLLQVLASGVANCGVSRGRSCLGFPAARRCRPSLCTSSSTRV